MKPLFIPLKAEFFDAFERGEKTTEYRKRGPRWNDMTCSMGRRVVLSRGYGKQRRLTGEIVGFHYDTLPSKIPGWLAIYGPGAGDAACITIRLDAKGSKMPVLEWAPAKPLACDSDAMAPSASVGGKALSAAQKHLSSVPKEHPQQPTNAFAGSSCQEMASFVAPVPTDKQDGHAGISLIGERAALAAAHIQGCCSVIARAAKGWVCLSCHEVHVVPRPGWYSPQKYASGERMRRALAVRDGKCESCGKPVSKENRRLCDRHRLMALSRKRNARAVSNRAARASLYADCGQGFEAGKAVYTTQQDISRQC